MNWDCCCTVDTVGSGHHPLRVNQGAAAVCVDEAPHLDAEGDHILEARRLLAVDDVVRSEGDLVELDPRQIQVFESILLDAEIGGSRKGERGQKQDQTGMHAVLLRLRSVQSSERWVSSLRCRIEETDTLRFLAILIAASLLPGCGMNEKRYDKKVSKAYCTWQKRCRKFDFYSNFDGVGTCVDAQRAQLENLGSYYESKCTFDKKNAAECIDALESSCKTSAAEYDALEAACDAVWACPNDASGTTDSG